MALADIIEAVNAVLAPAVPGIDLRIGAEHITRQDRMPPAVVWVPRADTFAPFRQPTSRTVATATGAKLPKAVATRWAGVEARIWAVASGDYSDFKAVEDLIDRVVAATHQVCGPATYQVTGGEWLGGEGEEITQLGRVYVLAMRFELPVLYPATSQSTTTVPLTVITNDEVDGGMTFPSGDVADTPAP